MSFVDEQTGCEVVLVGCMHFNPVSVEKAARVTRQLSEEGRLGAVVVESCPSRWATVKALQPIGSPLRGILDNEMQAASEAAEASGRPVILGDQRVEDLSDDVREKAKAVFYDLATPWSGGWLRTVEEIAHGLRELLNGQVRRRVEAAAEPPGESFGLNDLLDMELLLWAPLSIIRYCISLLVKAPVIFAALATMVGFLLVVPESLTTDFFDILIDVAFVRIFLGALLRDRDVILARSIVDACKAYGGPERAVVAVLGAAHCNGVRRWVLLPETAAAEP